VAQRFVKSVDKCIYTCCRVWRESGCLWSVSL